MTQRLLFLLLLAAYAMSGAYEVFDNVLGVRAFNFDSSAPPAAKVAKEVIVAILLGVLALEHRQRGWIRMSDAILALVVVLLLILPTALLHQAASARVGYLYLLSSMAVLWTACKAASQVDAAALDRCFLAPVVALILATQLLEIAFAPESLYHEVGLLGLDRRAGLAVIPTSAACIGALALYRLRGAWRIVALAVILIANSSIGLVCTAVLLLARQRNRALLMALTPAAIIGLLLLIPMREGFGESSAARLDLVAESWDQLRLVLPSQIGALATTKSVALDPASSYIADASLLQFALVFGVIPGFSLFCLCGYWVWRATGWRGLLFFGAASSGFLVIEAWVIVLAMAFGLAKSAKPRKLAAPP
jgi:hypothetical protein